MSKKALAIGGAAVAAIAIIIATALLHDQGAKPQASLIDPADRSLVALGKSVYANHCAACHGANLEGQPEWRTRLPNGRLPAPPHDQSGHTWHHPDAVLFEITKNGLVPGKTAPLGYESDMPAYGGILSDREIIAVLAYIKSTWPAEALAMQKEVTLQTKK